MHKILHIINSLELGGAEILTISIAKEQKRRGHNVAIMSLKPGGALVKYARESGIAIIAPRRHRLSKNPMNILDIMRHIDLLSTTIVHTHLFTAARWGRVAALLLGKKVIYTEHGSVRKYKINNRLSNFVLGNLANMNIFISNDDLNYYSKYFRLNLKKCSILPNFVDPKRVVDSQSAQKGVEKEYITICSVGNLSKNKGKKYLISAIPEMNAMSPRPIKLLVCGDGPERVELVELTRKLGVEKQVEFLGNVHNIRAIYSRADLMIHPSTHEGFGLVIVEAMMNRIPVIATSVEGIIDILQDRITGYLIEPESSQAIVTAFLLYLSDERLCRDIVFNAYKKAMSEYTPQVYMQRLEKIYGQ